MAEHVTAAGDHQIVCALCQALASSGVATLPGAAVLMIAEQTSAAAIIALSIAPRVHTHSWRSRAPPSLL